MIYQNYIKMLLGQLILENNMEPLFFRYSKYAKHHYKPQEFNVYIYMLVHKIWDVLIGLTL